MTRRVQNLVWAKELEAKPRCIPVNCPVQGCRALGVRYEKAMAKALPAAQHGLWWEFFDGNGPGFCQTDLLLVGPHYALVLEVKYTYTTEAWEQLETLYGPVVEKALEKEVLGVQVCKIIPGLIGTEISASLEESIDAAKRKGLRSVLHWSGLGPLPRSPAPLSRRSSASFTKALAVV